MISMMKDDVAVSLASNSPSGVEETPAGHSAGDSNAASNSPDQRMSVQSPDPDRLPPVQPFPRALTEAPRADSAQKFVDPRATWMLRTIHPPMASARLEVCCRQRRGRQSPGEYFAALQVF